MRRFVITGKTKEKWREKSFKLDFSKRKGSGLIKICSGYLSIENKKGLKEQFIRKINNFWTVS
jgi:hypothetical protein